MLVLIARYIAHPGNGDTVAAALREMQTLVVQRELGCLRYEVCRATSNPDHFVLYEQYANAWAVEAHRKTEHFQRIVLETIVPLLAVREVDTYHLIAE